MRPRNNVYTKLWVAVLLVSILMLFGCDRSTENEMTVTEERMVPEPEKDAEIEKATPEKQFTIAGIVFHGPSSSASRSSL